MFHFVSRRSGVIASVRSRNLNAQRPVVSWIVSAGLAPRSLVSAPRTRSASGIRDATNTHAFASFRTLGLKAGPTGATLPPLSLIPLPEIHPRVQRRNLVGVAVEHLGLARG